MKPPIIILHGWNLSSKNYSHLSNILIKKGYKTYIPDMPGFGKTTLKKVLDLPDYKNFLLEYIRKHKIIQPVVIAHSFGGRVAIITVSENNSKFKSLILTGVPGYLPVPKLKVVIFLYLAKIGKIIFNFPVLSVFKNSVRTILYKAARASDYYNAQGVLRETFKKIIAFDLTPYINKLSLPVLLLWGKEEKTVPLSIAYKLNKNIINSQLKIIEGIGHRLPTDKPEVFADNVIQFIENL